MCFLEVQQKQHESTTELLLQKLMGSQNCTAILCLLKKNQRIKIKRICTKLKNNIILCWIKLCWVVSRLHRHGHRSGPGDEVFMSRSSFVRCPRGHTRHIPATPPLTHCWWQQGAKKCRDAPKQGKVSRLPTLWIREHMKTYVTPLTI